jgi:hypothetical protein
MVKQETLFQFPMGISGRCNSKEVGDGEAGNLVSIPDGN